MTHEDYMQIALTLAKKAESLGEVPVGAVLVYENQIISKGYNCPISTHDPTAHAEIIALRKAGKKLKNYRLPKASLYVTLEPCLMCLGAINHARVSQIVFGAADPKLGALRKNHHQKQINYIEGIFSDECSRLLKNFFQKRR